MESLHGSALAVSPAFTTDGTVFYGFLGAWRSTDAGASWTRLPGYARVDEGHTSVRTSGPWLSLRVEQSHGHSTMTSSTADALQRLEFRGRTIAWHALRDDLSGIAQVSIDGVPAGPVDLDSAVALPSAPVFQHVFPAPGWHVIEVLVTGTGKAASGGAVVQTDGFEFRD